MKRHVKLFKIFPILKLKWNIIINSKVMVQLRTLGFSVQDTRRTVYMDFRVSHYVVI